MNGKNKGEESLSASTRPSLQLEQLESRILLSAPIIQSLEDQPDPVYEGDTLTLTARQVVDPDGGAIVQVSYYRSDDDQFDGEPTDVLLGTGTQIGLTGDWEWSGTAAWLPGTYYYFAVAVDDGEGAGGIPGDIRFYDLDASSAWNDGEEIWVDANSNNLYDLGETQVYDGGDGWDTVVGTAGIQGNLLLQDGDASGGWSLGEAVWAEGVADGVYRSADDTLIVGVPSETSAPAMTIGKLNDRPTVATLSGTPEPIAQGDTLILVAGGVSDSDGHVISVDFYQDADNDGVWGPADRWLGRDMDGSDLWSWEGVVLWDRGDYFAHARDNDLAWGVWPDDFAVGHVNQKPVVATVTNDPNPVQQDQYVTFWATGVSDPDGGGFAGIATVEFYRDVDDSGHFNTDQDELLNARPGAVLADMGGGTWRLIVDATWDPDISPLYFARAQDTEDGWGDAVATLNQNPTLEDLAASPDPVTLDDPLTLEALGVSDSDGFVEAVIFSVFDDPGILPYGDPYDVPDFGWPNDWLFDENGTDDWTWEITPRWTITSTVLDDFDLDGDMDIAVAVDVSANIGPDFVSVLLNNGAGEFRATSLVRLGPPPVDYLFHQYDPADIASGDLDGDGYPDLVTANSATSRISVLLNNGDGTFSSDTPYQVNLSPHAVTIGDLNDDGFLDIAVASYIESNMSGAGNVYPFDDAWHGGIAVLFNDPAAPGDFSNRNTGVFDEDNFRVYSLPGPGLRPEDLVAADLDQDGFTDLAVVSHDGVLFLWNNGNFMDIGAVPGFFGDAGGVIGRAWETGITGAETQEVIYDYVWRNDRSEGPHWTDTAPYYHDELTDLDYDMYRVTLEEGALLAVTISAVPWPPGGPAPLFTDFTIWDSSGGLMLFVEDGAPGIHTWQAPSTGNYYVCVGGYDPEAANLFNPITGEYPQPVNNAGEYEIAILAYGGTYDDTIDVPFISSFVAGDIYEPNDSGLTPTLLGTLGAWQGWYDLVIAPSGNEDWFQFDLFADGTAADLVRIEFIDANGNLDIELYEAPYDPVNPLLVGVSTSVTDNEEISLDTLVAGPYVLRVYGFGGDTNTYDLITHAPGGPATGIYGDLLFYDADSSASWSATEDIWVDLNGNVQYDDSITDLQIYDPFNWDPVGGETGIQANVYFYDVDLDSAWDIGEFVFADTDADQAFTEGVDIRIEATPLLQLADGMLGTNANLYFWDANQNTLWDVDEDIWADIDAPGARPGLYDLGIDLQVHDLLAWDVPDGAPGTIGRIFFFPIAEVWSSGAAVWVDNREPSPDVPIGAGDSIVAANFLEDNYDDDTYWDPLDGSRAPGMQTRGQLLDIDVASANSQTNRVSVLFGNHYNGRPLNSDGADVFLGLYPNHDRSAMAGVETGRYDEGRDVRIFDASRVYNPVTQSYSLPEWYPSDWAPGIQGNVYFYDMNRRWDTADGQQGTQGEVVFDAGVSSNIVFLDLNSSGLWDEGEPVWADRWLTDRSGRFGWWDDTDARIYGIADWTDEREGGERVYGGNVYFRDENENGVWEPGEDVWADRAGGADGYYDAGIDFQIAPRPNGTWDPGEDLWADVAGALGVYDVGDTMIYDAGHWDVPDGQQGIQGNVYFYDANWSGDWSAGEDLWADMLMGTYLTGDGPTSITAYNIDADNFRDVPPDLGGDTDWWWAQGSVESEHRYVAGEPQHYDELPHEPYIDLVTTNLEGGSLTVLLNEGGHSGNFGIHEGTWNYGNYWDDLAGDFGESSANYGADDYTLDGPFDRPTSVMVGDFDGDGVQDFAVAERLNIAVLQQAFPFHSSDPLDLTPYDDEIAQVDLPFGFQGRYSVIPGYAEQLSVTYYARAHDEDYDPWNNPEREGYSVTLTTDVALNQRPLIWSFTANREAIGAGDLLTLTASGVEDLDGDLALVAFYKDDGDGVFEPEADGVYIRGEDVLVLGGPIPLGTVGVSGLLFADLDANAQYDSGEDIWFDANSNGQYDTGEDVYDGGDGWGIPPGTAGITGNVLFWDSVVVNGDWDGGEAVWAEQVDYLLGVDTDESDGWSFTGAFDGVTDTLYWARARDVDDAYSLVAPTLVNQRPTVAALYVDGLYNSADDTAMLGTPMDDDIGIRADVLFNDANFNRRWDAGEDIWQDGSGGGQANGVYDWEYRVDDGGNAVWDTLVGATGISGVLLFDDTNGDSLFNWDEEIWAENPAGTPGVYDDLVDWQVYPGRDGTWNTLGGAAGISGNVYLSDIVVNGVYDPTDEVWADASIDSDGLYHTIEEIQVYAGPNGWLTEDGAQGIQGNLLFRDDNLSGGWDAGEPIWADEVVERHEIVLTAVDVRAGQNSGGALVRKVHFYRDSNLNGVFDPYDDQFLGRGVNVGDIRGGSGDEWQFFVQEDNWVESPYWDTFVPVVNWSPGSHTYFAVAQDYGDRWSASVEARDNVKNLPPVIAALVPDPGVVTEGALLTLTAIGVDDPFGDVDYVAFYRDADGNGLFDATLDQQLGVDVNGTDGWDWADPATWPVGPHRYFARVLDNYGAWSNVVWVDGEVNARPVFGGTFIEHADSPVALAGSPVAVGTGDFDGNDMPDLIVVHDGTPGSLWVWLGNGDGTFTAGPTPSYIVENAPENLLVQDLDGDGELDLIVTNSGSGSNNVSVLLGNGDGTFTAASGSPFAAGTNPVGLALGNFDEDAAGNLDLAVTNNIAAPNGDVSILLGDGTGAFGAPTALSLALSAPMGIVVGDFDGDDNLDLAVAEDGANQIRVLLGDGTGAFPDLVASSVGINPRSLVAGDFDEDGVLDLAVANWGGNVSVLLGQGDGTFSPAAGSPFLAGSGPVAILGGRFDTDARSDLVVVNSSGAPFTVSVLLSNSQGEFASAVGYDVGSAPTAATLADFDLDGAQDVIVANGGAPNTLTVLMGIPGLSDAPDPVDQGSTIVLQATGLRDLDGDAIVHAEFYRDANANGALEVGVDERLDPGGVGYIGESDGGHVYEWQGTVTWAVGDHTYFVRALDSSGAWSYAVSDTGRVTNPAPVIVGGLRDEPDPVTEGYELTLVAQNVQDGNGTVKLVEFYLDDGDSSLDVNKDQLLGINDTAEGADFSWAGMVTWEPGSRMYFARAQDDLDAWSAAVSADGFVNGRPVLETLTASPNPVPYGADLTLTATGVYDTDPAGYVVEVAFYRDTNRDGDYDEGADEWIGSDTYEPDGWSRFFPAVSDTEIFFARAKDNQGGWSYATASDPVDRLPVVGVLSDSPDPVTYQQPLRLDATDVFDIDGYVDAVAFYRDADGDGVLEPGVDDPLGVDTTPGDLWAWTGIVTWPGGLHTYFAVARDNLGFWTDDADAAMTTGYVNRRPEITQLVDTPDPVTRGQDLTLEALGVGDLDGVVQEVEFYRDSNFSGALEIGEDGFLGSDTSATGGWTVVVSTAGWELGLQTYFARARDNTDAWSDPPLSTTGTVDGPPTIGALSDEPDPVTKGDPLTLTAVGVSDPEGAISLVQFYHDANANSTLEPLADDFLGFGVEIGTGLWEVTPLVDTKTYSGLETYFARAQDAVGAWSNVVMATGEVNEGPVISNLLDNPDPVNKGGDLTLTATGVSDPGGTVVEVLFYRDLDDDGLLTAVDELLGAGIDIGAGAWELMTSTAGWQAGAPPAGKLYWYFAQARDEDGGLSDPTDLNARTQGGVVTDLANVGALDDSPDPLPRGATLTLTATLVSDSDGTVVEVEFYRETNAVLGLQTGPAGDEWLDHDTDVSDGWSITYSATGAWPLSPPDQTYYARAQDDDGVWGLATSTTGTVVNNLPIVGSLVDLPDPVSPGQSITLEALGVTDLDGTVIAVEFYRDDGDGIFEPTADGQYFAADDVWIVGPVPPDGTPGTPGLLFADSDDSGRWDAGEEIWVDANSNGAYDTGEAQVWDGSDGSWDTPDAAPGIPGNVFFDDSVVVNGTWDAGEGVWAELVEQPGADYWLGSDVDGTDGWIIPVSTSGLPFGTQTYSARAMDNDLQWGPATSTEGTIAYAEIASGSVHGACIAFYDIDLSNGASDPQIAWGWAERTLSTDIVVDSTWIGPGRVAGIYFYGDGSRTQDIGIVVAGHRGLATFADLRRPVISAPIGFLAVEGNVGRALFDNGLWGAPIDGFVGPCGWVLPDIDGDPTHNLTGFYAAGNVDLVRVLGNTLGDVVADGYLGTLLGQTDLLGNILAGGRIGRLVTYGDVGSVGLRISAAGNIGQLVVIGGDILSDIEVLDDPWPTSISSIVVRAQYDATTGDWVGGGIAGNITASGNIGSVVAVGGDITGNVESLSGTISRVLAQALYDRDDFKYVGGAIGGAVTAAQNVWGVYAVGGDVSGGVEATAGSIGAVVARGLWNGISWTGGSVTSAAITAGDALTDRIGLVQAVQGGISASVGSAGTIGAIVASGGDIDLTGGAITAGSHIGAVYAVNGSILGDADDGTKEVAVTSGNLGSLQAVGGSINGVAVQVNGAPPFGAIGVVRATGVGGIVDSFVEAQGYVSLVWSAGPATGQFTAGAGLRSLYAAGSLDGDVTVTGNLGSVTIRGSVLNSNIQVTAGSFASLWAGGNVNQTSIVVDGWFSSLYAGGEFYNSSIQAGALARVLVTGQIHEDFGDLDLDAIHADTRYFFARDFDEYDTITSTHSHTFGGVLASVS